MNDLIPQRLLGVPVSSESTSLSSYARQKEILVGGDPISHPGNRGGLNSDSIASIVVEYAGTLSEIAYLKGEWGKCVEWGRRVGEDLEFYLLGDWQSKQVHETGVLDASLWFGSDLPYTLNWVMYLENYLPWVAVGRHWEHVSKVLTFPRPEVREDLDGRAARAYYLGLGPWWRDRKDTAGLEEAQQVRGAGSKMYHLLAETAVAISAKDEPTLKKALPKCVKHFLKRRDHNELFPMAATFLWNVAKKDGLRVELDPEIGKFLFEIPESYWAERKE